MKESGETTKWYRQLDDSYKNPDGLMSKKLNIVLESLTGGKLLDIGSGSGELITRVAERMDRVVGVEVNKNASAVLTEKTRDIDNTTIVDSLGMVAEADFDFCTALDVLEHMENPRDAAAEIHRRLRPGGKLIVTVPNWYDYLYSKALRLNPYHVTFHSPFGWKKVLRDAGFVVDSTRCVKWPVIKSSFLARKFPFWGMCLVIVCSK